MSNSASVELLPIVTLLGAAIVTVPLFKKLGLGAVLGYLAAGLAMGPHGVGLFTDPKSILHVAELGVVLFLFVIGLEMRPSRLWSMRGEIFGLGLLQVMACIGLLSAVGLLIGLPPYASFVAGTGFVMTSTAVVMQMLEERKTLHLPRGRKVVSILLLEDLAIVPLLAVIAFLAPTGDQATFQDHLGAVGVGIVSILAVIFAGRYLLDPLFSLIGKTKVREMMSASALFVVLGAALALQSGGLSMAMGAFLAGVLLSESSFRHQLESDIEPFRGLLLGLFFLGVGMAIDLGVVAANWALIGTLVTAYAVVKMLGIYVTARIFSSTHKEAMERAFLMAQGGEFAFVLYATATAVGLIDTETSDTMTATIILSMVVTPILVIFHDKVVRAAERKKPVVVGEVPISEAPAGVILIGFGRFGQIVAQTLIEGGQTVTLVETDTKIIHNARKAGLEVYYGDMTQLSTIEAARIEEAPMVIVAIDDRVATTRIVELVKERCPLVPVFARAHDRVHAVELIHAGADYQMRETFESALALGDSVLEALGQDDREGIINKVRGKDATRLATEMVG